MNDQPIIVAIDGPSGVGKTTTSKLVAKELELPHIDTGAMYRTVALRSIEAGLELDDEEGIMELLDNTDIELRHVGGESRVFSGGEDVTEKIRTQEVSMAASDVSKLSGIRRRLVRMQQEIGRASGGVMEGRDIGTKVFPESPHKFFLTATPQVRADRRWKELRDQGSDLSLDEIYEDQSRRDEQDATREDSPLSYDETYTLVDTSNRTIEEVVDRIVTAVREAT